MVACDIGVYGLGVMGAALARNMMEKGLAVAAYSISEKERERLEIAPDSAVCGSEAEFAAALGSSGVALLMLTAGPAVDEVAHRLAERMGPGSILIDGGNSHFADTARREKELAACGVAFLGLGVSGGEKGARTGPCMMAGGHPAAWERVRPLLERIAAKAGDGAPCCVYCGQGGAGHYAKMVHNGVEYAILQLIAEVCAILRGMGMGAEEMAKVFAAWRSTALDSYLVDICAKVLAKQDTDGAPLVEKVLDVAEQKGTGIWTVEDALRRGVHIPTIYAAVSGRMLSGERQLRQALAALPGGCAGGKEPSVDTLGSALLFGTIMAHAQGMALLRRAGAQEQWELRPQALVRAWRGGCIIRSGILEKIALASVEAHILQSDALAEYIPLAESARAAAQFALAEGIAAPGLCSAVEYYDAVRCGSSSMNVVQALRDCFGAHTYRRIDREGTFHTDWEAE